VSSPAITAGGKADKMNTFNRVFAASILLLGCLAGPSLAKDNDGPDVDGLCLSAYDICSSTCNIKFGRPGFSDELSFALCDDACRDDLRSCIATGDDAILRQNSRGRDAIKKLTDQVTVKRPG
jgi:hypothetical protein